MGAKVGTEGPEQQRQAFSGAALCGAEEMEWAEILDGKGGGDRAPAGRA